MYRLPNGCAKVGHLPHRFAPVLARSVRPMSTRSQFSVSCVRCRGPTVYWTIARTFPRTASPARQNGVSDRSPRPKRVTRRSLLAISDYAVALRADEATDFAGSRSPDCLLRCAITERVPNSRADESWRDESAPYVLGSRLRAHVPSPAFTRPFAKSTATVPRADRTGHSRVAAPQIGALRHRAAVRVRERRCVPTRVAS